MAGFDSQRLNPSDYYVQNKTENVWLPVIDNFLSAIDQWKTHVQAVFQENSD